MHFCLLPRFQLKKWKTRPFHWKKLFGSDGRDIEEKILDVHSAEERIDLIEMFLLKRLTRSETIDHIVKSTVETILTGNGQLSIAELSRQTCINRRQLERKFYLAIGLSPNSCQKPSVFRQYLKCS